MPRRRLPAFSLSFLDVMACGLGAVVLLLMIINHAAEQRYEQSNRRLNAEIERLENQLVQVKNNIETVNDARSTTNSELIAAAALSQRITLSIEQRQPELADIISKTKKKRAYLSTLERELKSSEETVNRLAESRSDSQRQGDATRTFIGQGDRQYLTGLKMGGKRILILVDTSASMLDETIVNVIRQRNLPEKLRTRARKWQRVTSTVDWLTTQIPPSSQFQVYVFNTQAKPVIHGTEAKWLAISKGQLLDQAVDNLRKIAPEKGTSLYRALTVIKQLKPRPDNIYLLTDGLPTLGTKKATNKTISAEQRLVLFKQAIQMLPAGIPVNIILFPMEGDPMAASAYWQLAQTSGGSFLTPASDWP